MGSRYISYLDLMCCGFGGALLMFLIVASAQERAASSEVLLVVRCRASGDAAPTVGAELGIEYRRVGTRHWMRANATADGEDRLAGESADGQAGELWSFQPITGRNQPAEAMMVVQHPRPGRWEIRAYLADFVDVDAAADPPVTVTLEVMGVVAQRSEPSVLLTPGNSTRAIVVEIPTSSPPAG